MTLTLNEYQRQTSRTDRTRRAGAFHLAALGLCGETGSLLSEVKKKQRDARSYVGYETTVIEELGDVLWYLATLASDAGIPLSALAAAALETDVVNVPDWSFGQLQPQAKLPLAAPTVAFERTLLKLAEATGQVAGMSINDSETDAATARVSLSKVFALLVMAADEAGVLLETAAVRNLQKTIDRWPTARVAPPLFDDDYPVEEQLPRSLAIDIFERDAKNGKRCVLQRCNGIFIGNRLTDNIMKPDDYRFHDVFHYAYAAVLGWSPVTRALFRLKRKSEVDVDEGQDGARAILIEEAIATYVFGEAKQLDFFEGRGPGDLSFTLLKSVRQFARGYESEACPLWLWEEAILDGNTAFRFLKQHRRGQLHLDLHRRSLAITELPS